MFSRALGAVFALVSTEIEFVCVSSAFFIAVPQTEEVSMEKTLLSVFQWPFVWAGLKSIQIYKKKASAAGLGDGLLDLRSQEIGGEPEIVRSWSIPLPWTNKLQPRYPAFGKEDRHEGQRGRLKNKKWILMADMIKPEMQNKGLI